MTTQAPTTDTITVYRSTIELLQRRAEACIANIEAGNLEQAKFWVKGIVENCEEIARGK